VLPWRGNSRYVVIAFLWFISVLFFFPQLS
jgi:hypothetical protein